MKLWFQAEDSKGSPDHSEKAVVESQDLFAAYGLDEPKEECDLRIADYREMLRNDPQVQAAVTLKVLARLSSGFAVEPFDDSPEAEEHAAFIQYQFDNMQGTMGKFLKRALKAPAIGKFVAEIVYREEPIEHGDFKGKFGLKALKMKKPEMFWPYTDKYGNLEELRHKEGDNEDWKKLEHEYFILWWYDHDDDWVAKPELKSAYRYYKAKQLILTIWQTYLDKYATPTPVATHPASAKPPAIAKVMSFLKNMHHKKAAVVPASWELKLLEAQRQGGDQAYKLAVSYFDRMIQRAVMLPNLAMDEGESGSYSLGAQHADNFTWVLDALGDEVADEIVGDQLIRRLLDWNYECDGQYPKLAWLPYSKEDLKTLAEAFQVLITAGIVDPLEEWVRERLDLPPKEETEDGEDPDPGDSSEDEDDDTDTEKEGEEDDSSEHAAGFPRSALKHSSKVDFQAIEMTWNEVDDTTTDTLQKLVKYQRDELIKKLRSKKIVEKRDFRAVSNLTLKGLGDFRDTIARSMANMAHFGAYQARREVESVTGPLDLPTHIGEAFSAADMGVHPITAEIEKIWANKTPVMRTALRRYYRRAFTVTGIYRDDVLNKVKLTIQNGMDRGAPLRTIERELNAVFNPYIENPGSLDPGIANPYRIETIVRTNVAEALNSGRWNFFNSEGVKEFIAGYEYIGIFDDRITDVCAAWHGTKLEADDPQVKIMWPPNHMRCRSMMSSIIMGERWKPDLKPAVEPAKGFRV